MQVPRITKEYEDGKIEQENTFHGFTVGCKYYDVIKQKYFVVINKEMTVIK